MTAQMIYQKFTRQAILCNLSGRQMQLWQSLYEMMVCKGKQGLQLHTPMLLNLLHISRSQFLRVRQALIDSGFLSITRNKQQQICYTLLLQGNVIDFTQQTKQQEQPKEQKLPALLPCRSSGNHCQESDATFRKRTGSRAASPAGQGGKQPTSRPNATRTAAAITSAFCPGNQAAVLDASGDIMQNMQYQQLLQEYCRHYNDFELKGALRCWSEMRRKNGWVLGAWGLQVLLEKLTALGREKISAMIAIVQQSIKRQWKEFHPLQVKSRPSGEKLLRLGEKEARFAAQQNRGKPLTVLKFKSEDEDLSFLEE